MVALYIIGGIVAASVVWMVWRTKSKGSIIDAFENLISLGVEAANRQLIPFLESTDISKRQGWQSYVNYLTIKFSEINFMNCVAFYRINLPAPSYWAAASRLRGQNAFSVKPPASELDVLAEKIKKISKDYIQASIIDQDVIMRQISEEDFADLVFEVVSDSKSAKDEVFDQLLLACGLAMGAASMTIGQAIENARK